MKPLNYTKGPWTLLYLQSPERPGHDEIQIITRKDRRYLNEYDHGPITSVPWGSIIATIPVHYWLKHAQSFKPDLDKQLANAELIAAAPELYTQNQMLRAFLKQSGIPLSEVRRSATKLAK